MLRTIIWRDLRWRLLAALALVVPLAALVAWSYATQPRPTTGAVASYAGYLDAAWFQLPGGSAVFLVAAVLVSAGGGLLRPRNDLAYLLALPLSRRRWLLTHLAASLAALATLVVIVGLVLAVGGARAGGSVAPGPLAARSLAVLVAAGPWAGVTLGALTLVRHPVLAATLVLGIVAVLPTTRFRLQLPVQPPPTMLARWDPWALADPRAWDGGPPFASLLAAAALGVAGTMLALWCVDRLEP